VQGDSPFARDQISRCRKPVILENAAHEYDPTLGTMRSERRGEHRRGARPRQQERGCRHFRATCEAMRAPTFSNLHHLGPKCALRQISLLPNTYRARENIDTRLTGAGWIVQDKRSTNLSAGRGVAVREFPLKSGHGEADYLLFVDGAPSGLTVVSASRRDCRLLGRRSQICQDAPVHTRHPESSVKVRSLTAPHPRRHRVSRCQFRSTQQSADCLPHCR